MYDVEKIYQKLVRSKRDKGIFRTTVKECLDLLQEKEEVQKKIDELDAEKQAIQKRIENTPLYLLHGGAYCRLLEIINDYKR